MVRDLFCRCIEALLVIRFRRRRNQPRYFVCTLGLKTHDSTIPPLDGSERLLKFFFLLINLSLVLIGKYDEYYEISGEKSILTLLISRRHIY